jgi:heme-degrading monooxygenase HmoA
MIAVIFESWPRRDRRQEYLDVAAALRPVLEKIDGFISVERYESLSQPGKILSLSFWRDENGVEAWRQKQEHRAAQAVGRDAIFEDYRIRVAAVLRDYGMNERTGVPEDSRQFHANGRNLQCSMG